MVAVVGEIVTILTSGFDGIVEDLANGVILCFGSILGIYAYDMPSNYPFDYLSPFFVVSVIFMSVSLGIGLCKWVVNYLCGFGRS